MLVFSASTVSSWTCLCACPTKWLSPCLRQIVSPTFVHMLSVSCLYNLQFIQRVQTCCACIFSKHCFFVDLFVRVSNQVAVTMYEKLGYSVYRRVLEYYSGDVDEDAFGKFFSVCLSVFLPICSCQRVSLFACLPACFRLYSCLSQYLLMSACLFACLPACLLACLTLMILRYCRLFLLQVFTACYRQACRIKLKMLY